MEKEGMRRAFAEAASAAAAAAAVGIPMWAFLDWAGLFCVALPVVGGLCATAAAERADGLDPSLAFPALGAAVVFSSAAYLAFAWIDVSGGGAAAELGSLASFVASAALWMAAGLLGGAAAAAVGAVVGSFAGAAAEAGR